MKLLHLVPIAFLALVAPAFAHVTVTPVESKASATETYTLRVPSEGGRTTTTVTLPVPAGVTIVSVAVPKEGIAFAYVRKAAGQPDEIVWTMELPAGAVAQLSFSATNPARGPVQWKIQQKYSNGTIVDWTPATRFL